MLFQPLIPPGPAVSPEAGYTQLDLERRAPADRPYVVSNFVSSADGKATARGRTALLGSDGDRAAFHLLRTQVDAVLVGTGTLRAERYGALVRQERLVEIRTREGRPAQPLAVLISRSGRIPFDIPLFSEHRSRVAAYMPGETVVPNCAAELTAHRIAPAETELQDALRSLRHEHGVRSLLCEGGPTLFNSMLARDLVDELFLTVSPTLVGGTELGITNGEAVDDGPLPMRLVWAFEHNGHLLLRYARPDRPS